MSKTCPIKGCDWPFFSYKCELYGEPDWKITLFMDGLKAVDGAPDYEKIWDELTASLPADSVQGMLAEIARLTKRCEEARKVLEQTLHKYLMPATVDDWVERRDEWLRGKP